MSSPSTTYAWREYLLDQLVGNANTLLSNHAPNYGPAWVLYQDAVPKLDGNRRMWIPSSVGGGGAGVLVAGTALLPSAAQLVSAQVTLLNANDDTNLAGVMLRTADPDIAQTGYGLYYSTVDQLWVLAKWIAGVMTVLASYEEPIAQGDTVGASLAAIAGTLYPLLNGTPRPTVNDAGVAGPGRAGLMITAGYDPTIAQSLHVGSVLIAYQP